MTSQHQQQARSPIVIIRNYPARAAPSSRVKILKYEPAPDAGERIQGNKTYLVDNLASIQSARISPVAATVGRLSLALSRLLYSFGPSKVARHLLSTLRQFCQEPRSIFLVLPSPSLSHIRLPSGYASNRSQRIVGNAQKGVGEIHHV